MYSEEWEPDYLADDSADWGDPEFLPGLPGLPSPSAALARRFFPQRRRPAARPAPRPAPTSVTPSAMVERIRDLDDRQKGVATQLAAIQQRTAVQQSAEHFGPQLTAAVGSYGIHLGASRDWFSPTLTHGLPLVQLLLASRGSAITSGFRANPWLTLGFPLGTLLLSIFSDKIPGVGPKKVPEPEYKIQIDSAARTLLVYDVRKPAGKGIVVRYETGATSAKTKDPDKSSNEFMGTVLLPSKEWLKLKSFIGDDASETVSIPNPY